MGSSKVGVGGRVSADAPLNDSSVVSLLEQR